MHSYRARGNHWELGAFAGTVLISDANAFRGPVARTSIGKILGPYSQFSQPSLELGARGAYLLLPCLGAELEGFLAPASTEGGTGASVLGARAQVIAQAPYWSITPFVVAGAGYWRIANDLSGNDAEPAFHIGAGAKAALTREWSVRLDLRDSMTTARDDGSLPQHFEALAGAQFEFGAPPPGEAPMVEARPVAPAPMVVVPAPVPVPADTDADGINDDTDQCPATAGVAPTGCPDTDGDQILDRDDACPDVAGIAPQGCPEPAPLAAAPETFSGVIDGIEFDSGQGEIRLTSHAALDSAVAVLVQHTELRIEVVGHTDDQGSRKYNVKLSQQRAEAVKRYLVEHGVDEGRVQARGVGPDEPLLANDSDDARQKNRRIEFRVSH